jgi:CRISPR-associated protein (TIGR03984 family)
MYEVAGKRFVEALDQFKPLLTDEGLAYAVLYTPTECCLSLVNNEGKFFNENGEFIPEKVFEARIFNEEAELRWLNETDDRGKVSIISDASFPNAVHTIEQTYLVWGRSTGTPKGDWTQFATARIGSFYVPLPNVREGGYAQIKAREYLTTYEDGNVAVVDERLVGIEEVK